MTDNLTVSAGHEPASNPLAGSADTADRPEVTTAHRPRTHPTKLALHALEVALCGQPVPRTLDSPEDRQRITEIQRDQIDAGWRQLRSRYPSVIMAARELHAATQRATQMVDDLLAAEETAPPAYGPVRAALTSTITRRLIVDGIALARSSIDSSRAAISGLSSNDALGASSIPSPRGTDSILGSGT